VTWRLVAAAIVGNAPWAFLQMRTGR
jgi:hypothetical protein